MPKNRLVIIGIDGAPYGLMKNLSDRGVMPNFKQLRKDGTFVKMRSSIPEVSSVSWSSIITGRNPGEHGIYGFTRMMEGTYTLSFPSFRDLKAPAFWQMDGRKHVVVNVPFTYPAQPIDGVHISGFVALDLEKAIYPRTYLQKLREFNYRVDIDAEKGHKSKLLLFKELFATLEARVKTYRYFWDAINWDVFTLVFTGSDRVEHFLWDAYENVTHECHEQFLDFFRKIDEVIGEIHNKLGEKDVLVVLSDHGMEGVKFSVNLNPYLVQEGLLLLENEPNKRFNSIKEGTTAFVLDPGRVYLNRVGRYPRGCVSKEREEEVLNELVDTFKRLKYKGENVMKRVYKKEEIYRGRFLDQAPDLVLVSNSGFGLKAGLFKEEVFEADPLKGKHTPHDAFLLVKGEIEIPANPSVEDIVGMLGLVRENGGSQRE
jgi:predicted AlkP superfamily phosphohydrolase/phosphomutase